MLRARRVRQGRHYDQEEVSREKRKLMMAVWFRSSLLLEAPACASQSFVLHKLRGWKVAGARFWVAGLDDDCQVSPRLFTFTR
jgi:hypothetical protein